MRGEASEAKIHARQDSKMKYATSSHHAMTIGFAKSAPPNYGLPGPRPVYLVGSEIVPLQ